ncbi:MAG: MATE family efflux transporter, partial [Acidimicrobiia bacterium]
TATQQLAMTLWTFLAFALDAIAIAAQAITGRYLGAGNLDVTRAVTDRMVRWGLLSGVVTGLGLAAAAPFVGVLFTNDTAVRDLLLPVLLVAAVFQPVAGVVFVLDGVLIGAGDVRYLAGAMAAASFLVFTPAALAVLALDGGLLWLWGAICLFMGARLVGNVGRFLGGGWLVTGAVRSYSQDQGGVVRHLRARR